ncbi:MAG: hypothetical protein K6F69_05860 [Treponema sp.]|nr:hypothetical protein [Treponema sp.]
MKKILLIEIILCLFFCIFPLYSQSIDNNPSEESVETNADVEKKSNLSFGFEFLMTGLSNGGWGAGFYYERHLVGHLAWKCGFGHSTFHIENTEEYCTTVMFSLFAEYYPFSTSLKGFYFALGGSFDYLGYFGNEIMPASIQKEFTSIYPLLGIKFKIYRLLNVELSCGYKFVFKDESKTTFGNVDSYLNSGPRYNASIKLII